MITSFFALFNSLPKKREKIPCPFRRGFCTGPYAYAKRKAAAERPTVFAERSAAIKVCTQNRGGQTPKKARQQNGDGTSRKKSAPKAKSFRGGLPKLNFVPIKQDAHRTPNKDVLYFQTLQNLFEKNSACVAVRLKTNHRSGIGP